VSHFFKKAGRVIWMLFVSILLTLFGVALVKHGSSSAFELAIVIFIVAAVHWAFCLPIKKDK